MAAVALPAWQQTAAIHAYVPLTGTDFPSSIRNEPGIQTFIDRLNNAVMLSRDVAVTARNLPLNTPNRRRTQIATYDAWLNTYRAQQNLLGSTGRVLGELTSLIDELVTVNEDMDMTAEVSC